MVTQSLTGLGGVGKSQLAAAYVARHARDYDIVAWIRAEDGGIADLAELGVELEAGVKGLGLRSRPPGHCAIWSAPGGHGSWSSTMWRPPSSSRPAVRPPAVAGS